MYEPINERISVIAVFPKDKLKDIRPFKMEWNGKSYLIRQVGYHHKYKQGTSTIHVFSATDGVNFFELKYNSEDLTWLLGRVGNDEVA